MILGLVRPVRIAILLTATIVPALPSIMGRSVMKAATCVTNPVVINNADSGAGSLRQAILDACDGSTITFANNIASPITLASELAIDKNLTIQGPGANALTISGNNAVRVFNIGSVNPAINVAILGLTITAGHTGADKFGGGILDNSTGTLNVVNSIVSGNTAMPSFDGGGGGIYNSGAGTVNVTGSIISGNSAPLGFGGGILNNGTGTVNVTGSTISGNFGNLSGGGIFNASTGTANVTNTAIIGNSASSFGGGIFNGAGTLTVVNSTISGNSIGFSGGGVINGTGGNTTITNSTISNNTSSTQAGGVSNVTDPMSMVKVKNTIIALNSASTGPDGVGAFTSQGHNLIGKADGSTGFNNGVNGDQVGSNASPLNPKLGPLQNNGGPTSTMALLTGSPAIETGDDSVLGAPLFLTTDQRGAGFPRKVGAHVDIGAFELSFDTCLKDSSTGNLFLFNSTTGQYKFTRCSDGFMLSGTGVVRLVNGILTLTDSKPDRRVSAGFITSQRTGSAIIYIMIAPGVWQTFRINSTNPAAVCSC
jgi:hypothetical protein